MAWNGMDGGCLRAWRHGGGTYAANGLAAACTPGFHMKIEDCTPHGQHRVFNRAVKH